MATEREKMLAGEPYDPLDRALSEARDRARDLCRALNATREADQDLRRSILSRLFGSGGDTVWMQPPFFCDYGANIHLGERVFFNFNCVVLDVCEVRIGDYTLFGPAVQIYTPPRTRWTPPCGGSTRWASRSRLAPTSGSAAARSSARA